MQPSLDDVECADEERQCERWAREGECDTNKSFMRRLCRASCGECTLREGARRVQPWATGCRDLNSMCSRWSHVGECERNVAFMKAQCRVSCGYCASDTCSDSEPDCAQRAVDGGCFADPFMVKECMWTCRACGVQSRPECARAKAAKPAAARPGDVKAVFEQHVLKFAGAIALAADPWVVVIDDFITNEEADALVEAAGKANSYKWERSLAGDGETPVRTSSHFWCRDSCTTDPTVVAVQERVAALTGVPASHGEPMQILRYQEGQIFNAHHDQNSPRASPWGPRLFTAYMYLSDVAEGGETNWPRLTGVTVKPKKGRLLLWSNTEDRDPFNLDVLSEHESKPPLHGSEKLGAIFWIHMWPFSGPAQRGCDNDAYLENWS